MTIKTASAIFCFTLSALAAQPLWAAGPPAEPLVKAAAEKGAVVTPSGLVYLSLRDGKGLNPVAADTVRVNYRGTFIDGREFDSSYKRGVPATFPLNRVIPCWTEGVQLMKVGGKAKLTCPSAIAYGERGAGNEIPPNSILNFEVELLGIAGK
jgi:FKBP-type peptidyl-prolyl cis-trans isomerase FkpA